MLVLSHKVKPSNTISVLQNAAYRRSELCRLLVSQGITFDDLAKLTKLNVRTLHNVASGNSQSRRARHKIENALGLQIDWAGGDEVTARSKLSSTTDKASSK